METKVEDINLGNTGQVKAMGLMRFLQGEKSVGRKKHPALSPEAPDIEVAAQEK